MQIIIFGILGGLIISGFNYYIRIALMKRRHRKEIDVICKEWETEITNKFGIEFNKK